MTAPLEPEIHVVPADEASWALVRAAVDFARRRRHRGSGVGPGPGGYRSPKWRAMPSLG